jgi:2-methylisocitrate lyase-like PEP mutase family enzyme
VTREQKYETFKALHEREGILVLPNPWNAGSAKILTALGFEALATTSAGFAFSIGKEDTTTQLSRDGILANAKEIVDSTPLPISADLQDGFGPSPETCAATIRFAASTGLAGGSIEDATGNPDSPIYDLQLSVERIQAAAEAAHTHHFLLTARAENFLYDRPNLKDTIRRLQSFAEAGADVLYAPGLSTLADIREVCASVPKPVNVLTGFGTFSVEQLAAVGVKRISVGGSLARAAFGAFERAAREIKAKGTFTYEKEAISYKDMTAYMTNPKS